MSDDRSKLPTSRFLSGAIGQDHGRRGTWRPHRASAQLAIFVSRWRSVFRWTASRSAARTSWKPPSAQAISVSRSTGRSSHTQSSRDRGRVPGALVPYQGPRPRTGRARAVPPRPRAGHAQVGHGEDTAVRLQPGDRHAVPVPSPGARPAPRRRPGPAHRSRTARRPRAARPAVPPTRSIARRAASGGRPRRAERRTGRPRAPRSRPERSRTPTGPSAAATLVTPRASGRPAPQSYATAADRPRLRHPRRHRLGVDHLGVVQRDVPYAVVDRPLVQQSGAQQSGAQQGSFLQEDLGLPLDERWPPGRATASRCRPGRCRDGWSIWGRRRRCRRRWARACGAPGRRSPTGTRTVSGRAAWRRWWRPRGRICRGRLGAAGAGVDGAAHDDPGWTASVGPAAPPGPPSHPPRHRPRHAGPGYGAADGRGLPTGEADPGSAARCAPGRSIRRLSRRRHDPPDGPWAPRP